ncbi:MAG TPA: serine protease [Methanobacterium sp.]|nr:serine protease [Methanobacterium sp.]
MRSSVKILVFAVFILFVLAVGNTVFTNIEDAVTLNSSNPSSSVVYVESGVSGAVAIKDPTTNQTVNMNVEYFLTAGSGVIVTSNGYVITAFHVIGDPQTLENQQRLKLMSNDDLNHYVEQAAVTEYLSKYNPQLGQQLNSSGNLQGYSDLTDFFVQNNLISVNSAKQVIRVKLPSKKILNNYLDAQLIDTGNPDNEEDVALLKVNYPTSLPALSINSNNPAIGKHVRIFGYPAVTSFNLASSSGSVVNRVVNSGGIVYYEANAPTTNGYSGGPALDNANRVLGIVIYGIQSRGHFSSGTNTNYSLFLSSDYLIQICKKNGVPINIY